jgi:adenosylcobinamide-phosphate synthase
MATGAGALGLRLGGSASYDGVREQRPIFGFGKTPSAKDINHALRLVNKTLLLWLVLIAAVYL